jgi:hypothetical protein
MPIIYRSIARPRSMPGKASSSTDLHWPTGSDARLGSCVRCTNACSTICEHPRAHRQRSPDQPDRRTPTLDLGREPLTSTLNSACTRMTYMSHRMDRQSHAPADRLGDDVRVKGALSPITLGRSRISWRVFQPFGDDA